MSARLRKQISLERDHLHRLIETHRSVLEDCRRVPPNVIELSALAAFLHAFYNGIENIFKRIVVETGGSLPVGDDWHRQLLDAVAEPAESRPAVITSDLREKLSEYLAFRHFFRHAYTFELQWQKMRSLVLGSGEILTKLGLQLDRFLDGQT